MPSPILVAALTFVLINEHRAATRGGRGPLDAPVKGRAICRYRSVTYEQPCTNRAADPLLAIGIDPSPLFMGGVSAPRAPAAQNTP